MAAASHPDGSPRTRREDEEGEEGQQPGAEAAEDRISALPEALRLQVLCLLPLKPAIRTGALSTHWRALWTRRWPAPSSLDFRFAAFVDSPASPHPVLQTLERRGLRRLDRLALSFGTGELEPEHLRRCLDYAAACAVEDLRVHLADQLIYSFDLHFRLPLGDPHLARLSIRGISVGVSDSFCARSHAFSALEAIHLHRVYIAEMTLQALVAACPLLRTLDLRCCAGLRFVNIMGAGAHLTSLTVAECPQLAGISAFGGAFSLRSFRYSGSYVAAHSIPATSALADLCICFSRSADRPWARSLRYGLGPDSLELHGNWLELLTNLSKLTVLTLCSSALRGVSARARARNAVPCKLHNLREFQLLMFAMSDENMDDFYAFLMNCCGPRLERLFVQLPTRGYHCAPEKELSGSESEEDGPVEELSEGEVPEEDDLDEVQSEAFENLMLLKMINCRGHDNEMPLVRLVLKKSTRLNQLILFTPKSNHSKGLKNDHMNASRCIETKLLPLKMASPNAEIILGEPDDSAIQPFHCEGFVKVK